MRRLLAAVAAAFPIIAAWSPATAGPTDGFSSGNVEFLANVRVPYAGGGKLVGDHFFVSHANGFDIFDVGTPESPQHLSQFLMPGGGWISFPDPDTDGNILLMGSLPATHADAPGTDALYVVDVSDKTNPSLLATVPEAGDHTYTCVLDCTWAYGGGFGYIVDLRDPTEPELREETWIEPLGVGAVVDAHDVEEVAPGMLLTASNPMFLLDARSNPARPKVLARSDGAHHSYGGVSWPGGLRGKIALSFSEPGVGSSNCSTQGSLEGTTFESAFKTWDASHWRQTGLFTGRDVYRPNDGIYADGNPPAGTFPLFGGCAAAWFEAHPDFSNGGLVVTGYGSYGTKFLEISERGRIKEVGYWMPIQATSSMAAYWITDEIVYALNMDRGIDILRFVNEAR